MKGKNKTQKKRVFRKLVGILVILVLLAGVGFFAYSSLKAEYTVTYDGYTATTGSISNALSFSGNLSLIDSATYSASSSGTVRTVYVAVGEEVDEDAKLVRLSNGETITAGFAGRINKLNVSEGDEITQGTEVVQVADFRHLKVSFRVDEYDIGDVSVGQACTVTVTSTERQFETTIDAIDYISASGGNVAYYTATAYVDVDDAGTLPGMQVTVNITQEEAKDAVILKVDAISFDQTNQVYVWMKDESGELTQVYIKTGVSNGNYIEVTEGLSDGDEVYVEAEETETSVGAGLLSSLFGGQQMNQPQGGMPGGYNNGGGMPGGDMPGGGSERSGSNNGARSSGGQRPGGGN